MKLITILIIITSIFICESCKEETISNPVNYNDIILVKAQVDLQSGFAGKVVTIRFNKESVYHSILSDIVSLAGPEATFITYIPKGENNLFVYTQNPNLPSEYFIDSAIVNIGDKEKYFLGLQIADSLKCIVQDSSFLYM